MSDPEAKALLLQIAECYERMARLAEANRVSFGSPSDMNRRRA
jgi:hypothetical protein